MAVIQPILPSYAGLDVVVEGDVAALHADRPGAGEPGEVRAGTAELDAVHVGDLGQRLGGGDVVVVDGDAAADVDDAGRLLQFLQRAFGLHQRLLDGGGDAARVGRAEGHRVGQVQQAHRGRIEHAAHLADVDDALLEGLDLGAELDDRAAIALGPVDLHLAGLGELGIDGGNEGFLDVLHPQEHFGVPRRCGEVDRFLREGGRRGDGERDGGHAARQYGAIHANPPCSERTALSPPSARLGNRIGI
ncbi:hypothetical protein [Mesorhizobium sp. J428]|uniref:hypothetical protein n=1 Tax=Mesorhizobium sp. J428 TaxID=2898440 RepID=UPI0035AFE0EA